MGEVGEVSSLGKVNLGRSFFHVPFQGNPSSPQPRWLSMNLFFGRCCCCENRRAAVAEQHSFAHREDPRSIIRVRDPLSGLYFSPSLAPFFSSIGRYPPRWERFIKLVALSSDSIASFDIFVGKPVGEESLILNSHSAIKNGQNRLT